MKPGNPKTQNKWLNSSVKAYIDQFGLTKNPVVYDVGSRDAKDGVELAERIYEGDDFWRDADITAIECNPPHIEQIQNLYPHVRIITEAIATKPGKAEFLQIHGDKDYMGSSSLDLDRTKYEWVKKTSVIEVKTRRLDDIIQELKHTEIDIMKIDIEGYTYEALVSMGKLLRNVKVFHLETEIEELARNKNNLDVFHYMLEKGYQCKALEYEWGHTIQDQVWVRK